MFLGHSVHSELSQGVKAMKKIYKGKEARNLIKKGIDTCVDVVKVTLGGNGKNVLIYNGSNSEVINDGVSIAKDITQKEELMAGIRLAIQCAEQTDKDCDDGTTTTLVLLQSILNEIIQDFETENPRKLRDDLFKEANKILKSIKPTKVKTREDIYNLVMTSSLNEKVAETICDIYDKLGKDAKISIEEVTGDVLESEIVDGIQFEAKPAEGKLFNEFEKETYNDIGVLVSEVPTAEEIQAGVNKARSRDKSELIIIGNQFTENVLLSFRKTNGFQFIPIEYSQIRTIEDVKDFVGNETVSKVIVDKDSMTMIGGKGDVKKKVKALKEKKNEEQSEYEKEQIDIRIGNLSGGIATIKIGKSTDVERYEIVKKIEDSIGAVRGAYESGYVLGGGVTLSKASKVSSNVTIQKVCESPYKQICENYGEDVEVPENVIDSFKSVKHSLLNALSTATSVLTIEAALIEIDEED